MLLCARLWVLHRLLHIAHVKLRSYLSIYLSHVLLCVITHRYKHACGTAKNWKNSNDYRRTRYSFEAVSSVVLSTFYSFRSPCRHHPPEWPRKGACYLLSLIACWLLLLMLSSLSRTNTRLKHLVFILVVQISNILHLFRICCKFCTLGAEIKISAPRA